MIFEHQIPLWLRRCPQQEAVYFDTQQRCLQASAAYAKLCAFDKADDMVGVSICHFPCGLSVIADALNKQLSLAMRAHQAQYHLLIAKFAQEQWHVQILTTHAVRNSVGKMTGSFSYGLGLANPAFYSVATILDVCSDYHHNISLLSSCLLRLDGTPEKHIAPLSSHEQRLLFWLLRYKNAMEIGQLLRLPTWRINEDIEVLVTKFAVSGKHELLAKAADMGFRQHIPQNFFQKTITRGTACVSRQKQSIRTP